MKEAHISIYISKDGTVSVSLTPDPQPSAEVAQEEADASCGPSASHLDTLAPGFPREPGIQSLNDRIRLDNIGSTLRHAELLNPDDPKSWVSAYRGDVRFLLDLLKRRQ